MKKVVVYTSDTCGYCIKAKAFLNQHEIPFEERNVSHSMEYRRELMQKGFMGVPIILVDDETIQGFDQPRLEQLLLTQ